MAKGYQSYRGRRSAGTRLLIAALVIILVGACCFLLAQEYIAYTDDGRMGCWSFACRGGFLSIFPALRLFLSAR